MERRREPQQLRWSFAEKLVPRVAPALPGILRNDRRRLEVGLAELEEFIRDVGRGRIEPPRVDDTTVVVPLRAADDELYFLEICARGYPRQPPGCRFVDAEGRRRVEAWPAYDPRGPFRPPEFICSPPTAEFYEYHPERRYRPEEGTLVNTVGTLYAALHGPGYSGRFDAKLRGRRALGHRLRRNRHGEGGPR